MRERRYELTLLFRTGEATASKEVKQCAPTIPARLLDEVNARGRGCVARPRTLGQLKISEWILAWY
jgi:hypothetical protein